MLSRVVAPDLACPAPRLSVWYVKVGDVVLAGERIAEILVDGATIDVVSPETGRVRERCVRIDEVVTPGQLLAAIESEPPVR